MSPLRTVLSVNPLEAREVPATLFVGDGFGVYADPVVEGGTARFRVTPHAHPSPLGYFSTLGADFTTVDDTATAGSDYTVRTGHLEWAPGDRSTRIVEVQTLDDTRREFDETFRLRLAGEYRDPLSLKLLPYQTFGTGTIQDNDADPRVTITGPSAPLLEGQSGTTAVTFTIALSHPSDREVRVGYETVAGSATAGDYDAVNGVVVFAPGEMTKRVTVAVRGDTTYETNEAFSLRLTGVTNGTIQTGQAQAIILNDDLMPVPPVLPAVRVSNPVPSISEGDVGTNLTHFKIMLDRIPTQPVTVTFATFAGTASAADGDYRAASGTLTWAAGSTALERTVSVAVNGDRKYEGDEQFSLRITKVTNATVSVASSVVTIWDNETPPVSPPPVSPPPTFPPISPPVPTPPLHDKPVVYRNGAWYFDVNGDGHFDEFRVNFGLPGDTPILADWDGNGVKDLTVVRANPARGGLDWYVDLNRDGGVDAVKHFGLLGDTPVAADFNADGRADMMAVRANAARGGLDWYIDLDGQGVYAETVRQYGLLGDVPVTGDWNGDGRGDLGVTRTEGTQQFAYLDTDGHGGLAEERRLVASAGQRVVAGDWNGDGRTDFGTVTVPATGLLVWRFDVDGDGSPDKLLQFGLPGDSPLAGR